MKKFWIFYSCLPLFLIAYLIHSQIKSSVSLPSQVLAATTEKPAVFAASLDSLDPNTTLELVNEVRSTHGLPALVADETLGAVAQARAEDMVAQQYYAHQNPAGKYYYDYFTEYGIETKHSCENLDLLPAPNQDQVVAEWLLSNKGHKECLLDPSVSLAGYASASMGVIQPNGTETSAYIVVAIHIKP